MSLQMCSWLHSTKGNGSQTHHLVKTIRVRTHKHRFRTCCLLSLKTSCKESIPADGSGPWIELIAQAGGKTELTKLFEQIMSNSFVGILRFEPLMHLQLPSVCKLNRPVISIAYVLFLLKKFNHSDRGSQACWGLEAQCVCHPTRRPCRKWCR